MIEIQPHKPGLFTFRNLLRESDGVHDGVFTLLNWAIDIRVRISTSELMSHSEREEISDSHARFLTKVELLLK